MQRKYRGYWLRGAAEGSPVGASWEMTPKRPNNVFASIDMSGQVNRIGRVHNAGSQKMTLRKNHVAAVSKNETATSHILIRFLAELETVWILTTMPW